MFKRTFTQTLTAMFATVVLSATCLTAAIGPAQPDVGKAAVAMAAKFVA